MTAASKTLCGDATPSLVAVLGERLPGARDELHGADGAVEGGVAVQRAAVGVADRGGADRGAVEAGAEDAAVGGARAVDPAAGGVPGLDAADAGDEVPRQAARRVRGGERGFGGPVGGQHRARDPGAVGGGRGDGRGRVVREGRSGRRGASSRCQWRGGDRGRAGDLGSRVRAERRAGHRCGRLGLGHGADGQRRARLLPEGGEGDHGQCTGRSSSTAMHHPGGPFSTHTISIPVAGRDRRPQSVCGRPP